MKEKSLFLIHSLLCPHTTKFFFISPKIIYGLCNQLEPSFCVRREERKCFSFLGCERAARMLIKMVQISVDVRTKAAYFWYANRKLFDESPLLFNALWWYRLEFFATVVFAIFPGMKCFDKRKWRKIFLVFIFRFASNDDDQFGEKANLLFFFLSRLTCTEQRG